MITDTTFFTCAHAAIKLISYMELEQKAISMEKALRNTGYREKKLYPRHLEKTFKAAVNEGKTKFNLKSWYSFRLQHFLW